MALIAGLAVCATRAGSHLDTSFTGGTPSSTILAGDSIALAVDRWALARIFGDVKLSQYPRSSRVPDLFSAGVDSFTFFWSDSVRPTRDDIYREDLRLYRNTGALGSPLQIGTTADIPFRTLEASQGGGVFLATAADKNASGALLAFNGIAGTTVQNPGHFASNCHYSADTFLVVYSTGIDSLKMVKVVSAASIAIIPAATVALGGVGVNSLSTSAVAADRDGNILVVWLKGTGSLQKSLQYRLMDRTMTDIASGTLSANTSDLDTFYYFNDAQIACTGPGSFVVVSWDATGIWMHRVTIAGGASSRRLVNSPTCRFPAVAANDSTVVIAWRGAFVDGASTGIEGMRFRIRADTMLLPAVDTMRFSGASTTVTMPTNYRSGGELNVALDPLGSVGVTWVNRDTVYACAWANRPITFRAGAWLSPLVSLPVSPGDSVRFYPGVDSIVKAVNDTVTDSIRLYFGPGDTSAWVPANDSAALAAGAKGPAIAFQHKIYIARRAADVLAAPKVWKVRTRWNVRPAVGLDSVTVNRANQGTVRPGDTVTVMARSDTVRLFAYARDADTGDALVLSLLSTPRRDSSLNGALSYRVAFRFDPAPTSSVIPFSLQVTDGRGWSAASGPSFIKAVNPLPRLSLRIVLDTAASNRRDTVSVLGAQAVVVMQEQDTVSFLYSATDQNDPSMCVRIRYTEGGVPMIVDSACGGSAGVYVVAGARVSDGQMRTADFLARDPDTTVSKRVVLTVNHAPVIDGVTGGIRQVALRDGDSVWMNIKRPARFAVAVADPDVAAWDSITYRITGQTFDDSVKVASPVCTLTCNATPADTTIRILVHDLFNKSDTLYLHPQNHAPAIDGVTGGIRQALIRDGDSAWMNIKRPARFAVAVADPDVAAWDSITYRITGQTFDDSVKVASPVCTLTCNATPADTAIRVVVHDLFGTSDTLRFYPQNHPPLIWSVSVGGTAVRSGDTVRMIVGRSTDVSVTVRDTDVAHWDSITYTISGQTFVDSVKVMAVSQSRPCTAGSSDTILRIRIRDIYGAEDSVVFYSKHPWFDKNPASNPEYAAAKDSALNGLSLVDAGPDTLSVRIPLRNVGNDTMSITGLRFKGGASQWLTVSAWQDTGAVTYTSMTSATPFLPIPLNPKTGTIVVATVNAGRLTGDGIVRDTLYVFTSDPLHPFDTIPFALEYNDLPRVVNVSAAFNQSVPYWLAKGSRSMAYSFPPHARLTVTFSEPMDTATFDRGVVLYSLRDSSVRGSPMPLLLARQWSNGMRTVSISPTYPARNAAFPDIEPLPGLFIPTDRIVLILSSKLRDQAATPSGPNPLDVRRDYMRHADADTAIAFTVDSITFTLQSVTPDSSMDSVRGNEPIVLLFSARPYANTVDTQRVNNRSLSVFSRYNGGRRVDFDSVVLRGVEARFYPSIRFFSGDSISCRYFGVTARDGLGYPVDVSGDGIPANLFDSSAATDNVSWFYRIRPITVVEVLPRNASRGNEVNTPVTIRFSDPVPPGIFDLDTGVNNLSVSMVSAFAGGRRMPVRDIRFSSDSTRVTFSSAISFYSYDSVACVFAGFSSRYSYDSAANLPVDTSRVFGRFAWHFFTRNEGCYTYPNPYKPGIDSRHCSGSYPYSPCGIWFKNLHTLKRGINEVRIAVLDQNGYPVYDSRKAGATIHFETTNVTEAPQWKWDTRNQRGEFVATGFYFYAIYDNLNNVLKKGKLLIVR